ncbi:glycoside hydrolase family 43 [Rhizobium sp. KAs_5_22]|nr:glycoside hydrolase family 43 [Rhizobium sp. KAs_5_22]
MRPATPSAGRRVWPASSRTRSAHRRNGRTSSRKLPGNSEDAHRQHNASPFTRVGRAVPGAGRRWTLKGRRWIYIGAIAIAGIAAYVLWTQTGGAGLPAGIASGNGRIEAVEIDISAKTAGRLQDILVSEGAFVKSGQTVAQMDTLQLVARKREAEAQLRRAKISIETARSVVAQRRAERESAAAVVEQRQAELDAAESRLARSEQLIRGNTISQQVFDDDRSAQRRTRATLAAARASQAASEAGIGAANMQVIDAEASVEAAKASIESLEVDIADATLKAPRDGRIQYRVAQPGEVLSSGGRVVNMIDITDVYMTFFLATEQAGRISIGSEVRLVMDAVPGHVIPAKVSFVADVAQFTPKTVETEEERLKLMFRVRAQIPPDLLQRYLEDVKTGLPGTAYVRVDPATPWPALLEGNLVR